MQETFLDRLLAQPAIYGLGVSPNGRMLSFLMRSQADANNRLYLSPTDGSAAPRRLLADRPGWDISEYYWSFDSSTLIIGQSRDGKERIRLLRLDLATNAVQPLSEDDPPYYIHGGSLHPDNRSLVFSANCDPTTEQPAENTFIYRQDIQSGQRQMLARLKTAYYGAPRFSRDGEYILYHRADRHPAGRQPWLMKADGSDDMEIYTAGDTAKVYAGWAHTDAGDIVLLLAEIEGHRRLGLYFPMERRLQWVLDDPARNIESFSWPLTMRLPLISEYRQARLHEFLFDPSTGKERRVQAPGMPGQVSLIGNTPEQDWLALHYGAQYPLRCLRCTGAPDDLRPVAAPLTDIEPGMAIPAEELRPAEDFHYRSGDGTPIQGWLTRANGTARGTILYIHGGPTAHDEDEFSAQAQYLARCGFHIFQPNYRGSTGFSLPFQESIKKQGWGGAEQEDIKAGIEALIAAGVAEPGKIGITGVSYGGYSSWWAITHFPTHLIAAAAPICGMTDLAVDYETTRPDLRPYSEEMMGGTPTQVPERYRERSPINYVENIRGKLLIVQGLNDPNVTPRNVTEVRARLDAAGIPYETLVFADEGHGIAKPANRRTLYLRLAAFFSAAFQAQAA